MTISQDNNEINSFDTEFFDKLQDTGSFNMFNYPEFKDFDFKGKYDPETNSMWFTRGDLMYNLDINESTLSTRIKNIFKRGELEKDDPTLLRFNQSKGTTGQEFTREVYSHRMSNALAMGARKKRAVAFKKWLNRVGSQVQEKSFFVEHKTVDLFELDEDIYNAKLNFDKILKFYTDTMEKHAVDYQDCLKSGKIINVMVLLRSKLYHYVTGGLGIAADIKYARVDADKENMGMVALPKDIKKITYKIANTAIYYFPQFELEKMARLLQACKGTIEGYVLNKFELKVDDFLTEVDFQIRRQRIEPILRRISKVKPKDCKNKIEKELEKHNSKSKK